MFLYFCLFCAVDSVRKANRWCSWTHTAVFWIWLLLQWCVFTELVRITELMMSVIKLPLINTARSAEIMIMFSSVCRHTPEIRVKLSLRSISVSYCVCVCYSIVWKEMFMTDIGLSGFLFTSHTHTLHFNVHPFNVYLYIHLKYFINFLHFYF